MAIGRAGGYRSPVWEGEVASPSALPLNPPLHHPVPAVK